MKPLRARRLAEPFEALRDAADATQAKSGKRPAIFLACWGAIADHNMRSTWVKNYLAAGGIEALTSDGYATADEAASAFKASGATAACICSNDAIYATDKAEATAKALKAAGAKLVRGRPPWRQGGRLQGRGRRQLPRRGSGRGDDTEGIARPAHGLSYDPDCDSFGLKRPRSIGNDAMTRIPDFTKIDLGSAPAPAPASAPAAVGEAYTTPEGIAVKPVYAAADRAGLDFLDTYPGLPPYLRGPYPTDVRHAALDDPPVRGVLHGRGFQRLLPPQPRGRTEGPVGRLRSRHPSRL